MSEDEFDFTGAYGGEAAKEGGTRKGGNFDRLDYLGQSLKKDGDTAVVRFLTDHKPVPSNPVPWITVDMHSMVPPKPQPADWPEGANWPSKGMSAVCRNDKTFKAKYGDCYICAAMRKSDGKPYKATSRTWALAVLREEVYATAEMLAKGECTKEEVGTVLGTRDKTKEVVKLGKDGKPIEGETLQVPHIVIVQQSWGNFWSIMQGYAGRFKTVLDADYFITRQGTGLDTKFNLIRLDPIMREDGSKYDLRDPATVLAKYPHLPNLPDVPGMEKPDLSELGLAPVPDLRHLIRDQASDEFYARFFDPSKTSPPMKTKDGDAPAATPASPVTEVEPDKLAKLKEQMKNRLAGNAPQTAGDQAPAPAKAPAAAGMRAFD